MKTTNKVTEQQIQEEYKRAVRETWENWRGSGAPKYWVGLCIQDLQYERDRCIRHIDKMRWGKQGKDDKRAYLLELPSICR